MHLVEISKVNQWWQSILKRSTGVPSELQSHIRELFTVEDLGTTLTLPAPNSADVTLNP